MTQVIFDDVISPWLLPVANRQGNLFLRIALGNASHLQVMIGVQKGSVDEVFGYFEGNGSWVWVEYEGQKRKGVARP